VHSEQYFPHIAQFDLNVTLKKPFQGTIALAHFGHTFAEVLLPIDEIYDNHPAPGIETISNSQIIMVLTVAIWIYVN
jgi:hypothetical protein